MHLWNWLICSSSISVLGSHFAEIGLFIFQNSPKYFTCVNPDEELSLQYKALCSLDFVEEKLNGSNKTGSDLRELYLGMLYSLETHKMYVPYKTFLTVNKIIRNYLLQLWLRHKHKNQIYYYSWFNRYIPQG